MGGLSSGSLDREIVLQTATKSTDPVTGQEILTWDPANDQVLWAEWLAGDTREVWVASQRLTTRVDGIFRMYDMDTRPTPDASRILFDGRLFDVLPYVELGRSEGLAVAVVASGS